MDPWILEDGTKVHLGGRVEGDSWSASDLRATFAELKEHPLGSGFGPIPHEDKLDVKVAHLLDCWLRNWSGYKVTSGPAVEYPELEPRPAPPEGAVY